MVTKIIAGMDGKKCRVGIDPPISRIETHPAENQTDPNKAKK
jgi:hypothetical protein